jgi:hypothetical protein
MKCPKCGGMTFKDADGFWSICGWREPIEPFPDAMERPPTRGRHATLERYNDLKREERQRG